MLANRERFLSAQRLFVNTCMKKINLGVVFGGKSSEHEVSIVTALQTVKWIDKEKYNPVLIYIDRQNQPFLCPFPKKENYSLFIKKVLSNNQKITFINKGIVAKKLFPQKISLDCYLLALHGAYGEDGKLQGLLDFYGIPYTGSGVLGSALGIDKVMMKKVFESMKLNLIPYEWFTTEEYHDNQNKIITVIENKLRYPFFVKPSRAGSSIGISKVKSKNELKKAVEKAMQFDNKILIEQAVSDAVDINCAVMGGEKPITSVCEQPLIDGQFLTYEEKYLKGGKNKGMAGLCRIVPAPIPDKIAKEIQETTRKIFRELNCWGCARMDFLFQKKTGKVFVNEINTIPGSLSYYLWEASGIKPAQLINRLVELALEREKEIESLNYTFKSKILGTQK